MDSTAKWHRNHLWSVAFRDANQGWAVGTNGTILTTSNGAKTWRIHQSNTNYNLFSVAFQDASSSWLVGENGTIINIFIPDDSLLRNVNDLETYSTALDEISKQYNFDLSVFQTNAASDQKELSEIEKNLERVKQAMGRLKANRNNDGRPEQTDDGKMESTKNGSETDDMEFVDPLRDLSADASMTLNFTCVGVIGFIIYFINLLSNLYRYNLRLAAFYDSRADVLELKRPTETDFSELIANFSPDHLNFGRPVQNPASQAIELTKELLKARKG